jgi:hypothetical protein
MRCFGSKNLKPASTIAVAPLLSTAKKAVSVAPPALRCGSRSDTSALRSLPAPLRDFALRVAAGALYRRDYLPLFGKP